MNGWTRRDEMMVALSGRRVGWRRGEEVGGRTWQRVGDERVVVIASSLRPVCCNAFYTSIHRRCRIHGVNVSKSCMQLIG